MPRGFLVKRTKRGSAASYRTRETEPPRSAEPPRVDLSSRSVDGPPTTASATCPDTRDGSGSCSRVSEPERVEGTDPRSVRAQPTPGNPGEHEAASPGRADASHSPTKPVGSDQGKSFFERCLSSPAAAESFPTAPPAAERMLMLSRPSLEPPVHLFQPLHQALKRSYLEPERKAKSACKKAKVGRKLSFEDEVTISPVLGLQIKKEGPELKAPPSARRRPLGEFICQLCKEEYPDPFSLAQHRCSRIVRVEYRCPECDKVFSCPANLASHRRWHKPRPASHEEPPGAKKPEPEKRAPEGKENSTATGGDQHHAAAESDIRAPQRPRAADGAHSSDPRRSEPAIAASYGHVAFPCHLCGARFPSAETRDKHELWHAQILACKHCSSTFFSSPGLARHMNKAHPTESRQVMLLQMAIRPGC
ncbi:insulinoma-associated protein 2 [Arapaima gigas]